MTPPPHGLASITGLRSRVRPGFLLIFSVAGLAGVLALALLVSRIVASSIRTDHLANATSQVELLTAAAIDPHVTSSGRLTVARLNALDKVTLTARRTAGVSDVTIWGPQGRVLYSTDHREIASHGVPSAAVLSGFQNQTTTTVRGATAGARQIDV